MDVLKPELMWIGGRCYRVNKTTDFDGDSDIPKSKQYVEDGKTILNDPNKHQIISMSSFSSTNQIYMPRMMTKTTMIFNKLSAIVLRQHSMSHSEYQSYCLKNVI